MKLADLQPEFLAIESEKSYRIVPDLKGADGIIFSCPLCIASKKFRPHSVICWQPHVGQHMEPKPGRWLFHGTGCHDLTFDNTPIGHSSSVQLGKPCEAHFHIRNGAVELLNPEDSGATLAVMQDVIGGIAVMQRTRFPGVWRIWLRLYSKNGQNHQTGLCFTENTEPPGLAEQVGEPLWQFTRGIPRHGWLDCKPSVREMTTDVKGNQIEKFHNTGNWQVQYVEMCQPEPEPQDESGVRWARGHTVHFDLNNASLTGDQRAELFDELRQSGVIY